VGTPDVELGVTEMINPEPLGTTVLESLMNLLLRRSLAQTEKAAAESASKSRQVQCCSTSFAYRQSPFR
jgi:hypothetical protein